ncbi:response regulator transcription factor [bacterium]|nr:response regulator transcription factor [bacterium]
MKLDLSDKTAGLVASRLKVALEGEKIVLCFKSRLELAALAFVPEIRDHVVGGATTAREGAELLKETFATMLITDCTLEAGDGISLAHEFRHLKTICLTDRENAELICEAEEAGVSGLIFRSAIGLGGEGAFLQAIGVVARGGVSLSPAVNCIVDGGADKEALEAISDLTDKEREVLSAVGRGLDNKEAAEEAFVSEETVKSHLRAIREKLGEKDRVRLALTAIRAGI